MDRRKSAKQSAEQSASNSEAQPGKKSVRSFDALRRFGYAASEGPIVGTPHPLDEAPPKIFKFREVAQPEYRPNVIYKMGWEGESVDVCNIDDKMMRWFGGECLLFNFLFKRKTPAAHSIQFSKRNSFYFSPFTGMPNIKRDKNDPTKGKLVAADGREFDIEIEPLAPKDTERPNAQ